MMRKIVHSFVISGLIGLSFHAQAASLPYFSKIYQLALEHDDKTKATMFQAESADFQVRQAKSALYPDVQLQGGYSRNDYKYNPKYNQGSIEQGLFSATVQVNQSLYDPRHYAAIKVERYKRQSAYGKLAVQKMELAQTVLPLYLDEMNTFFRIQLQEHLVILQQSKWQKAQKLLSLHLVGQADALQAKVALDNAQIELQKQRASLRLAKQKLQRYIGEVRLPEPDMALFEAASLAQQIQALAQEASRLKLKTNQNAYVRYAQANLQVAQAQLKQAKSDFWPKAGLTASYSVYDTDTPDSQNSYENTRRIGVNVSVPLYSGGRTSAQVEGNQRLYQSALSSKADTQKSVEMEWKEAQVKLQNAVELLPLYRRAIESSQISLNVQQKKYDKGLTSIIELNDATSKLFEAKYHYVDNLTTLLNAYIKLLVLNNQLSDLAKLDKVFES